jgi:hypothetical protein
MDIWTGERVDQVIELPHKQLNSRRAEIQQSKYEQKTDWDERERFLNYIREYNIQLIPYQHYEKEVGHHAEIGG